MSFIWRQPRPTTHQHPFCHPKKVEEGEEAEVGAEVEVVQGLTLLEHLMPTKATTPQTQPISCFQSLQDVCQGFIKLALYWEVLLTRAVVFSAVYHCWTAQGNLRTYQSLWLGNNWWKVHRRNMERTDPDEIGKLIALILHKGLVKVSSFHCNCSTESLYHGF